MATVRLYLDARGIKEGNTAPLKIKITSQYKVGLVPTGVRLHPNQWNADRDKVVSHPQERTLNAFIRKKMVEVEDIVRTMPPGMNGKMMAEKVKMGAERTQVFSEVTFASTFRDYASSRRSPRTQELYNTTYKRMVEYDTYLEYRLFEDIDIAWLERFDAHLCKTSPSTNARAIHYRNIRSVFNYAVKELEVTHCYPFHKFKIKHTETAKRSLSSEQLRQLFTADLYSAIRADDAHRLRKYVDIFKLSFYLCGIRPIDLSMLRKEDLVNGRIEYKSRKGGVFYSVKAEPEALEIINRYPGSGDYLLDIMDGRKNENGYRQFFAQLNDALKNIGKVRSHLGRGGGHLVGESLFPNISIYWARHSWATIAIELGFPMETVSAGLGHLHGEEMTLVYVAFRQRRIDEANRVIIDYICVHK